MWRNLALTGGVVLVLAAIAVLAVVFGPPTTPAGSVSIPLPGTKNLLAQQPVPAAAGGVAGGSSAPVNFGDALVIPNCRLNPIDKQDVPTIRDGQLLYVATELTPEERAAVPDTLTEKELEERGLMKVVETFVYTEWKTGDPEIDVVDIKTGKPATVRKYRRVREGEDVPGKNLELVRRGLDPVTKKDYHRVLRKLKVGDEVKENQLLALIDPRVAIDEFSLKKTKLYAAEADWEASVKTRDEAEQRWKTLEKLRERSPAAVSLEELRGARLTYDRYFYEEVAKKEGIGSGEKELNQALTLLLMHEVRAKVPGIIHKIYHHKGDAVKNQETLIELVNHDRLRAEGRVEFQYLAALKNAERVVIEPTQPWSPKRVFPGHRGEVKAIAVSHKRNIISGSDDGTARIWDRHSLKHHILDHPRAVQAVACTPEDYRDADGNPRNLVLTGCDDGYPRLWDVDQPTSAPVAFQGKHNGPITGVAFPPSGNSWCATAGKDKAVCLWDPKTGAFIRRFDNVHQAPITSIQFLSREEILTAGADQSLAHLTLNGNGELTGTQRIKNRSGDLTFLGVHPGKKQGTQLAIVDQVREIRILDMPSGSIRYVAQNRADTVNVAGFAVFSPNEDADGFPTMLLTGNSGEGRFQLWRMPTSQSRGYELRQYMWPGATSCGAFSPMNSDKADDLFIATGTRDHNVVLWDLPTAKEVAAQLTGKLTLKGPSLDGSSRELQVWAEVENTDRRLWPGQTATVVIYPPKPK